MHDSQKFILRQTNFLFSRLLFTGDPANSFEAHLSKHNVLCKTRTKMTERQGLKNCETGVFTSSQSDSHEGTTFMPTPGISRGTYFASPENSFASATVPLFYLTPGTVAGTKSPCTNFYENTTDINGICVGTNVSGFIHQSNSFLNTPVQNMPLPQLDGFGVVPRTQSSSNYLGLESETIPSAFVDSFPGNSQSSNSLRSFSENMSSGQINCFTGGSQINNSFGTPWESMSPMQNDILAGVQTSQLPLSSLPGQHFLRQPTPMNQPPQLLSNPKVMITIPAPMSGQAVVTQPAAVRSPGKASRKCPPGSCDKCRQSHKRCQRVIAQNPCQACLKRGHNCKRTVPDKRSTGRAPKRARTGGDEESGRAERAT